MGGENRKSNQCAVCALDAARKKRKKVHGGSGTTEYLTWSRLRQTGQLCKEWLDFKVFRKAVGSRPQGKKIVRPNPLLPYGPGNCEWGDNAVGRGRPQVRLVKYGGKIMTTVKLAKLLGVTRQRAWAIATDGGKCRVCQAPSRSWYCQKCRDSLKGSVNRGKTKNMP